MSSFSVGVLYCTKVSRGELHRDAGTWRSGFRLLSIAISDSYERKRKQESRSEQRELTKPCWLRPGFAAFFFQIRQLFLQVGLLFLKLPDLAITVLDIGDVVSESCGDVEPAVAIFLDFLSKLNNLLVNVCHFFQNRPGLAAPVFFSVRWVLFVFAGGGSGVRGFHAFRTDHRNGLFSYPREVIFCENFAFCAGGLLFLCFASRFGDGIRLVLGGRLRLRRRLVLG